MPLIRRKWTPQHADEWTREDWITIVISPINYILLMIGTGLSMLMMTWGFILLGIGIVLTIVMHWVINPKLKVISDEYETRQQKYLEDLEKSARWEETDG